MKKFDFLLQRFARVVSTIYAGTSGNDSMYYSGNIFGLDPIDDGQVFMWNTIDGGKGNDTINSYYNDGDYIIGGIGNDKIFMYYVQMWKAAKVTILLSVNMAVTM